MKLTKDQVDAAKYTGKGNARCVLWCNDPRGFGLRVYPSGLRTFIVSYRDAGGAKRLLSIGNYGTWTVDQARTEAKRLIRVVDTGADPVKARKDARAAPTFGDLAKTYLEQHAVQKRSEAADRRRLDQHALPLWKNRKLATIEQHEVNTLVRKIGTTAAVRKPVKPGSVRKAKARPKVAGVAKKAGRPYEANRLLALLSVMFNKAPLFGLLPADHPNPCEGIPRFKEAKRGRWVDATELPRLAAAIDAEADPYARAALWLYLLTGCRKTELLSARWADVDSVRKVLALPMTKSGEPHEIPLSPPAMTILDELPREHGNPYVFPGRLTPKNAPKVPRHMEGIRGPWDRVRVAAGVADVRLHDLRRTVGSWLAQSGNSLHLIGRVLNHSKQSTTAIYAKFGEDHVRSALDAHAAKILGAAGKLPAAPVTDIKEARKARKK